MENENLTSKQKLDNLLGIKEEQSIDDFLNGLSLDTDKLSTTIENIDDKVKDNIQMIDEKICQLSANPASPMILVDLNSSMKEIEDLISLSKKMFKHVYEGIVTSDLIDSELLGAAGKLLESIHINIAEFISLYRDKQKYIERIQTMTFQQEQRKELMLLKHKLDLEKMQQKLDENAVDVEGKYAFSVEELTKKLNDIEQAKAETE